MNFNNSPQLLRNAKEGYRKRGLRIIVADGHIVAGINGVVARCTDDESACKLLEDAGYTRDTDLQNLVFFPGRPLAYFEEKYGPDFLAKLPMYKTAKLEGEHVAILETDPKPMLALVRKLDGKTVNCSVHDMDDFVL